jgi:hypothetical protein
MSILCAVGGHEAGAAEVYNGGYYFSRCKRCGRDMIRCGAAWQMIPEGHRVVWKGGRHRHSLEPDFAGALPVLHRDSNLPAVRGPFASWSRDVVRLKRARFSRPVAGALARSDAELEEAQYPRLLVAMALIGSGLQLLMSFGSGRTGLG